MSRLKPDLFEHPLDVLRAACRCLDAGKRCALAVVTATEGGAVRAPGALMAIDENGNTFGYLSGGCIDNDVALRAVQALRDNAPINLTYGTGSPFVDIRLPCGGTIHLQICPDPDPHSMTYIVAELEARRPVFVSLVDGALHADETKNGSFLYRPILNLRLVGKGTDLLAIAGLARMAGFGVEIWSPDQSCLAPFQSDSDIKTLHLESPSNLPAHYDDPCTAFVLMFHDVDWETRLLRDALDGHAFYIGAVGSRKTHERRCETLLKEGTPTDKINRIRGPIGLVPSMRDASMLAISVLAEIVSVFHVNERQS